MGIIHFFALQGVGRPGMNCRFKQEHGSGGTRSITGGHCFIERPFGGVCVGT
ncbi:unannotated protein [freshwater metagenome]|uniref:Unannotated protein n=1 Tax=freshwater metagenome TaxID=449393 RepID=A0A6J7ERL2_9ZZZZ